MMVDLKTKGNVQWIKHFYEIYCFPYNDSLFAIFLPSIIELILSIILLAFFLVFLQNLYNLQFHISKDKNFYLSFSTPVAAWFYLQFSISLNWILLEDIYILPKKKKHIYTQSYGNVKIVGFSRFLKWLAFYCLYAVSINDIYGIWKNIQNKNIAYEALNCWLIVWEHPSMKMRSDRSNCEYMDVREIVQESRWKIICN